jgi:hypothetical protein
MRAPRPRIHIHTANRVPDEGGRDVRLTLFRKATHDRIVPPRGIYGKTQGDLLLGRCQPLNAPTGAATAAEAATFLSPKPFLRCMSGGALGQKLFLEGMITHHQGAVAMAEIEIKDGKSLAAVQFARNIVKDPRSPPCKICSPSCKRPRINEQKVADATISRPREVLEPIATPTAQELRWRGRRGNSRLPERTLVTAAWPGRHTSAPTRAGLNTAARAVGGSKAPAASEVAEAHAGCGHVGNLTSAPGSTVRARRADTRRRTFRSLTGSAPDHTS